MSLSEYYSKYNYSHKKKNKYIIKYIPKNKNDINYDNYDNYNIKINDNIIMKSDKINIVANVNSKNITITSNGILNVYGNIQCEKIEIQNNGKIEIQKPGFLKIN